MLENFIKPRMQGSKDQGFFSICSYTWNSKLGNTFNGLMMQLVAQKKLRPTQVNGGAKSCVGNGTTSKAFRPPQGSSVRKCS